jgi:CYTH domain
MKERSDFVEHEIKVLPNGRQARLIELVQAAAPPGWRIVRKPHVAFFDVYFDTPTRALSLTGNHLRVRFDRRSFSRKGRYKLFFKKPDVAEPHAAWVSRREVRTDLRRDEFLQFAAERLPGLAAELAYEQIAAAGGAPPLEPTCVMSTFRRYYTMQSPDRSQIDCLNVGIEQSSAFDARTIDMALLLTTGFIDGPGAFAAHDFELAEAELTVENEEYANVMFLRLASNLAAEFTVVKTPKYELCLHALGIVPAGARASFVTD